MTDILELIKKSYSQKDAERIIKAYYYAEQAHEGQKRASGEDYFIHPCCVSQILIELGLDASTICAAFLHDTIEDTFVSEGDIDREFGGEVLTLVQGVTKLEKIEFKSQKEEQAENFKKIFISMANDIRVIIIKLADRLHNMRSLNFLSKTRQLAMAHETLDIYAPLAGRLGISQIKCELEDLCLKYLEPDAYEFLKENIATQVQERKRFVSSVVEELKKILEESDIHGEVFGRPKHFYSIYRKMQTRNKTLDQIYDLSAVRVIVETVDECYEILGKIHKRWVPVPGRIKDYIAMPKANMYQSLHTTVVTSFGQTFEIQIRTFEMHKTAEFGIAAHWKYKEKDSSEEDSNFDKRLSWIREVMEWQSGLNSTDFVESLKGDLYSQEVLVFTPKGEVISLGKDATPIDFAYKIHTEVGNKCTGAKVNGKIVPLSFKLSTGDIVEIVTNKNSKGPSWDWLKIAASPSARVKIKQFFRRSMVDENIKAGKAMLESQAQAKGYVFSRLLTNANFEKVSEKMNFNTVDEMYAAVGCGAVSPLQVIYKFIDLYKKEKSITEIGIVNKTIERASAGDVVIKGVDGLLIRYAGCCNPVPGDKIVGFVSRGRGVTVHRADCPNMANEDKDRILPAEWTGKSSDFYVVSLKIHGTEQAPLMFIVSSTCTALGLFCLSFNGRVDAKTKTSIADMTVRLNKSGDLETLINKLKENKDIIDVFRAIV